MFNVIKYKIESYIESLQMKKLKKKYPTWNYENWVGDLEFIWGIKSWDCLLPHSVCMHTMNDIDIIYNHKIKEYSLSIETAYSFKNNEHIVEYLEGLLKHFETYMDSQGYDKTNIPLFYMGDTIIECSSDSIEELYGQFRMFVAGWKNVVENSQKTVK